MWDIQSHSGQGRLIRQGRVHDVSYNLDVAQTRRVCISGTLTSDMDALPGFGDLFVADLELQNGTRLRVTFTHVDPLKGTASFYLNTVNS